MLYFFAIKEEQWATHSDQYHRAINALFAKEGYGRIEKISFETYNEGTCLIEAAERFRERSSYYPKHVFCICSDFGVAGADVKAASYKYLLNQQSLI